MLGARFESKKLIDIIAQRRIRRKKRARFPLFSYTLDDMWKAMVRVGDAIVRLPAQSFELGGVLVERANKFLAERPASEDAIRCILTLKLATMREDGEPTQRREFRAEFSREEWRLVSELAGYPNRFLVTATTVAGETYAEVAHEAIFKRWVKLKEWVAAEREFLAWCSGLEAARRASEKMAEKDMKDALLIGFALTQAQSWLVKRSGDIPQADRTFMAESRLAAQRRKLRSQGLVGVLLLSLAAGVAAWWNQDWVKLKFRDEICALANATLPRDSPGARPQAGRHIQGVPGLPANDRHAGGAASRWGRPKVKAITPTSRRQQGGARQALSASRRDASQRRNEPLLADQMGASDLKLEP